MIIYAERDKVEEVLDKVVPIYQNMGLNPHIRVHVSVHHYCREKGFLCGTSHFRIADSRRKLVEIDMINGMDCYMFVPKFPKTGL